MVRNSILVVFSLGVAVPSASARPAVYVAEPESEILFFTDLPLDQPSPTQRIVLRNIGTAVQHIEVSTPYPFQVAATGGDLGEGGEMWFDITCTPYRTETEGDSFWFTWCARNCEDEATLTVWMTCDGNLVSFPSPSFLPVVEQYQVAEMSYEVSNPRSEAIAIDAVSVAPPFTAALESGPVSLGPGESTNVHVTFQPDGRLDVLGRVDILSGGRVAGRFDVEGSVYPQIWPFRWDIQAMPLGAEYTVPIAIRNASLLTRTITGVSFSAPGVELSDVVGAVMAPGEVVHPLLTIDADARGRIDSEMTIAFDAERGDSMRIQAGVRDADFFAEMEDDTPADGRLDFGTLLVGSGPVAKRIRVHNRSTNPRQMQWCPQSDTLFQVTGDCPTTIAPGGSADLIVTFTPSGVLDYVRTLDIPLFPDLTMTVALSARVVDETPGPDPGDDGGDDGSGDDGTGDDGTEDDGSGDDGSEDDGSADGSADDGAGDDGTGDDGAGDDGAGDDGGHGKKGGGGCRAAGGDHGGVAAALALVGLAVVRRRGRPRRPSGRAARER